MKNGVYCASICLRTSVCVYVIVRWCECMVSITECVHARVGACVCVCCCLGQMAGSGEGLPVSSSPPLCWAVEHGGESDRPPGLQETRFSVGDSPASRDDPAWQRQDTGSQGTKRDRASTGPALEARKAF